MSIHIETIVTIGKGLSVKREKQSDDTEKVIAHLKFSDLLVLRETVDELLGQPFGFSQMNLFDELGAPRGHWVIALPKLELTVTGSITGTATKNERLTLKQALLTGVEIALADKGAKVSGELTWEAAGDEVSDAEPLLANICQAVWVLQDSQQRDLLKAA